MSWETNEYTMAGPENYARMVRAHHEQYTAPKIQKFVREKFAKKWLRNRAARPPGTLGPNNKGGELYKLWASKAANRWPKTRKNRKSRKSRKSRRN